MAATVIGLHGVGVVLLVTAVSRHYHLSTKELFGVGTGVLAYTLGMRHAFDADHISAIDDSTRFMLQRGKHPLGVGFFFSLGHSTVVFLLSCGLAVAARS
ncbi:MAG: HoxN/HupN/NixA family nickel/cobalt transporter, partial [Acidimicrobiales bacterium]